MTLGREKLDVLERLTVEATPRTLPLGFEAFLGFSYPVSSTP
jgi:hypothetical protein